MAWAALAGDRRPPDRPRRPGPRPGQPGRRCAPTWSGWAPGWRPRPPVATCVGTPLPDLQARLAALAGRADRLAVLPRVVSVLDSLRAAGLGALVDDLAARGVAVDDVTPEMERVWWISLLDDISVRDPRYGAHDGALLRRDRRGVRPRRPRPPRRHRRAGAGGGRAPAARGPGRPPRPGGAGAGRGAEVAPSPAAARAAAPAPARRSPRSSRAGR